MGLPGNYSDETPVEKLANQAARLDLEATMRKDASHPDAKRPSIPSSQFLNEASASELMSISVSTLQKYRHRGIGPRYYKFGKSVRYAVSDLMAYAAERQILPR